MSRFFERYLKKENVDNVACAREENNKKSRLIEKKDEIATLRSRVQSTLSTKSLAKHSSKTANYSSKSPKPIKIDSKHRFPACLNCLSYSWRADGNLMRPWCEKIDTGVFELRACPQGRWKKSKTIII
jgi:hypothetical protein